MNIQIFILFFNTPIKSYQIVLLTKDNNAIEQIEFSSMSRKNCMTFRNTTVLRERWYRHTFNRCTIHTKTCVCVCVCGKVTSGARCAASTEEDICIILLSVYVRSYPPAYDTHKYGKRKWHLGAQRRVSHIHVYLTWCAQENRI